MNVLVTGCDGLLASGLVDALLARADVGHVVAVGSGLGLPVEGPRLTTLRTDVARPRSAHDLVFGVARDRGVDTVFHDPLEGAAARSTRLLLHACEHHPTIHRFVLRSSTDVYASRSPEPTLLDEDSPLDLRAGDRVAADVAACTRAGGPLAVAVLRFTDILAPGTGSQLWDYLASRVCVHPLGFDPMTTVLSLDDAIAASVAALETEARGPFDIIGFDTLPLSALIAHWGRHGVALPGPLLAPLYGLRRLAIGSSFRYPANAGRFHLGAVPSGARARQELGYRPQHPIAWPV